MILTVHAAAEARLKLRPSQFDQELLDDPDWKNIPEEIRILLKNRLTVESVRIAANKCGVKFEKGRRSYDVWTADSCIHECESLAECVGEICTLAITPDKQLVPEWQK